MGLRSGISLGSRKKHIRIGYKFDWVEGVSWGPQQSNISRQQITTQCFSVRVLFNQTNKQTNKHFQTMSLNSNSTMADPQSNNTTPVSSQSPPHPRLRTTDQA